MNKDSNCNFTFYFCEKQAYYSQNVKRKEVKKMEKDNGQWITLQPGVQFYMPVQAKKEDIAFDE